MDTNIHIFQQQKKDTWGAGYVLSYLLCKEIDEDKCFIYFRAKNFKRYMMNLDLFVSNGKEKTMAQRNSP